MRVNRLRNKLVLVFVAATIVPLAAILWMSSALMSSSLAFLSNEDVTTLATALERVGREYYRLAGQRLKSDVEAGRLQPQRFDAASRANWPEPLRHFWESGDAERVILEQPDGERLQLAQRRDQQLLLYAMDLDGVRLEEIRRAIGQARIRAGQARQRNLPRGFTFALVLSSTVVWLVSLALVFYFSGRISRPIQQLTTGLGKVAGGSFETRLEPTGNDEVGLAIEAFNTTASRLQQSRDRLVYLTQVASWQLLARKMAHELKNSLTPIRLTVEEIAARRSAADPEFFDRAATIVVDEVASLERRVRAFSQFAAEPEIHPRALDLATLVRERVDLLAAAHPGVKYEIICAESPTCAWADGDQVRGILTNLLENAADAAGEGGTILVETRRSGSDAVVEVHDSGPGVSADARGRLFEPSISFKKHGMGLGLAISRKNALLAGGDLSLVEGRLGGAAFRLALPSTERASS